MNRRKFIQLGLTTGALAASGCSVIGKQMAIQDLPDELELLPPGPTNTAKENIDPLWRLLNRAGYGPRPGDYAKAQTVGYEQWLEQQLAPDTLDDTAAELIMSGLSLYNADLNYMLGFDLDDGLRDLIWATVARQIYSERQLYEAMVEFWSDHFTIYARTNQVLVFFKIVDDRDVIRPHALGNFRELLHASVRSPAMLFYLNNAKNFAEAPNENYARELMELHTLGVFGGYNQDDVMNVARILSGLTVKRRGLGQGQTTFRNEHHDDDAKMVMGQSYPAGMGEDEIATLVDFLVDQPATAEHIATKMVRRFVADEPPADLVTEVAQVFRDTDGDIKAMLRTIFLSEQFKTAPPKLKRPVHYIVSSLRALNVNVRLSRDLYARFQAMGQVPFMWPTPDGYPDVADAWVNNQLPRWNYANDLVHDKLEGVGFEPTKLLELVDSNQPADILDLFYTLLLGQVPQSDQRQLLLDYVAKGEGRGERMNRLREAVGLIVAGPEFQLI
ncbi:MAG: DUF1800 domain-containing protein [Chloroflexota bacterium]